MSYSNERNRIEELSVMLNNLNKQFQEKRVTMLTLSNPRRYEHIINDAVEIEHPSEQNSTSTAVNYARSFHVECIIR